MCVRSARNFCFIYIFFCDATLTKRDIIKKMRWLAIVDLTPAPMDDRFQEA